MSKYELYLIDTETTGTNFSDHEPIEISIRRLSTGNQKTWFLKPINIEKISHDALRVNGAKLEDLQWKTKEGRDKYIDPSKVLVEIENWLCEDMLAAEDRLIVAHNAPFDKGMTEALWQKCNSIETFPFNRKYLLDTMQIELVMDLAKDEISEGYSLYALTKKYGIVNAKAHSAAEDVKATASLFNKQLDTMRKVLKKKNA